MAEGKAQPCVIRRVHLLTHFSFTVPLTYKILIKFSTEPKTQERSKIYSNLLAYLCIYIDISA